MDITILAGKGGVGKSTISGACAINRSFYSSNTENSEKVLVIDYDRGHSIASVLADYTYDLNNGSGIITTKYPSNQITDLKIKNHNLSLAVINNDNFIRFSKYMERINEGLGISGYLKQFEGDYGLIPYCDMTSTCFGMPTEISEISKFASFVKVYNEAVKQKFDRIIIDIEPTAGLERLLNYSDEIVQTRKTLINTNLTTLYALCSKWTHIKAYLLGDYITDIHHYSKRIYDTVDALKSADYFIVTNPQKSPSDQMGDVENIIQEHGGKVSGYIVNRIEGREFEREQINKIRKRANGKKVVEVEFDTRLCSVNYNSIQLTAHLRLGALCDAGKKLESGGILNRIDKSAKSA